MNVVDINGKEAKLGDVILVSNGNYLSKYIFRGYGQGQSVQYFDINIFTARELKDNKKIWCSYLNITHKTRWIILSPDILNNEERKLYDEIKKYL